MTKPHFWRCRDCLAVVTTNDVPNGAFGRYSVKCGCGGGMDYLGQPRGTRIMRQEERVPCDLRCTEAIGPHCDCSCGGVNHGTGRLVAVTVDGGGIPRVVNAPDLSAAREYREAVEEAEARIANLPGVREWREEGKFIPSAQFLAMVRARQQLDAARKLRTHRLRIERLANVAA